MNKVDIYTIEGFKKAVANGRMFGVQFVKRGDGETRTMLARTKVTLGVKGVQDPAQRKSEDKAHNLLTVFDMVAYRKNLKVEGTTSEQAAAKSFRRISCDSLNWVRVGGTKYNYDATTKCLVREGTVIK